MKYISISGGLASHVDFDTKRGRTFQNLASMLYCCEEVDLRRTPSAMQLEKWLSDLTGPSQTFKFRMERMLSNLLEIACDTSLNKGFTGFSAKVSPAEFVFIGRRPFFQSSYGYLIRLYAQAFYSTRCTKRAWISVT